MSSCDGSNYNVLYDQGHKFEYTTEEMAQIVLLPELAKVKIGSRVSVLWHDDNEYYEATVTQERDKKRPHYLMYDDGTSEWIDLHQHKFRLLDDEIRSYCDEKYPNGTKVKKVRRKRFIMVLHCMSASCTQELKSIILSFLKVADGGMEKSYRMMASATKSSLKTEIRGSLMLKRWLRLR